MLLRFSPPTEAWLTCCQPWAATGPSKEQQVDNKWIKYLNHCQLQFFCSIFHNIKLIQTKQFICLVFEKTEPTVWNGINSWFHLLFNEKKWQKQKSLYLQSSWKLAKWQTGGNIPPNLLDPFYVSICQTAVQNEQINERKLWSLFHRDQSSFCCWCLSNSLSLGDLLVRWSDTGCSEKLSFALAAQFKHHIEKKQWRYCTPSKCNSDVWYFLHLQFHLCVIHVSLSHCAFIDRWLI